MKTILITIGQRHIREGKRCSTGACPLALALQETFPAGSWTVGSEHATYREDNYVAQYTYDLELRDFIHRFDWRDGEGCAEGRYRLTMRFK